MLTIALRYAKDHICVENSFSAQSGYAGTEENGLCAVSTHGGIGGINMSTLVSDTNAFTLLVLSFMLGCFLASSGLQPLCNVYWFQCTRLQHASSSLGRGFTCAFLVLFPRFKLEICESPISLWNLVVKKRENQILNFWSSCAVGISNRWCYADCGKGNFPADPP